MEKKIIFLDIDGTLAMPGHNVSDNTVYAIQEARKNGHLVYLCTGRNKAGIEYLLPIGFDGIISSAGSYIEVDGMPVYASYLTDLEIAQVRESYEKNHIFYDLEGTDEAFATKELMENFSLGFKMNDDNPEYKELTKQQENPFKMHDIKEYDANPVGIHKSSFVALKREDLNQFIEEVGYKYNVVVHNIFESDVLIGEIIKKGIDKGLAILLVLNFLDMNIKDTIGFGDSMNDLEMIQTCHYGVVMANGEEKLKQHAQAICESCEDDGMYHEFVRLGLIEER